MSFAALNKERNDQLDPDLEVGSSSLASPIGSTSDNLNKFTNTVQRISRILPILGTARDSEEIRNQVGKAIEEGTQMYLSLQQTLDKLDSFAAQNIQDNALLFNCDRLKEQSHQLHKVFDSVVREYNDKINSPLIQEAYEKMQLEKEKRDQNDETAPLLGDQQNKMSYIGDTLQQQQQLPNPELSEQSIRYHTDLIEQRDKAINSISQGVQDINKIFKDLDSIVIQQGEQIDSIENNIINHANNNQLATTELVKANNYQKRKRKWSCILLLALFIIFLILLALIS